MHPPFFRAGVGARSSAAAALLTAVCGLVFVSPVLAQEPPPVAPPAQPPTTPAQAPETTPRPRRPRPAAPPPLPPVVVPPLVPITAVQPSRRDVIALMRRAADYELAETAKTRHKSDWIRSTLYTGILATYRTTGDNKYREAAETWSEASQWSPKGRDLRFADNQACVQVYTELYELKKDPARIAPSRAIFDAQIAEPKPGRVEWWWCDALFMAPPAFARMSAVTGDPKYNTFLHTQYADAKDFLYDKEEHLFFRDKNYFDRKTRSGKKVFWARGNGWVIGGLARVISSLPASDPRRADYIAVYKDMAAKLADLQGADGVWRSSLLDFDQFPMPETSGSAFFTYALAWGVNEKLLDRDKYLPVAYKGWTGLINLVSPEGRLGWVQQVAGAPGPSRPENTQEYAVGALLLAGEQVAKLATK